MSNIRCLLFLAALALGATENAAAETVSFKDNGIFSTASLDTGEGVTVTGSDDVQVFSNQGLGIVGGFSSLNVDPGETISFSFVDPVTDVVISDFQSIDTDASGVTAPSALFESFAGNGNLINPVFHEIDPSLPINVSEILGAVPIFAFSITMNTDAIRIGNISFQGPSGVPVLSCSGFDSPFSGPLSIRKKAKGAIPAKLSLTDSGGLGVTDLDVTAPPVVNVEFNGVVFGNGDTDDAALESVGKSNEGNAFAYNNDNQRWEYRLGTKQFSEAGTYLVTVKSGDEAEYTIDAPSGQCTQTFTRQP